MNKYRAQKTEIDGILFASKKEAKRYRELKYAQHAGNLLWFIRQPSFDLPGGVRYRADFLEVWKSPGEITDKGAIQITDVKGFKTQVYKLKKKQVEQIYGIKIVEI